ncbi:MAG TPA: rod shape-determining protein MreC [Candidatus Fimadaptatus faecigallinarum]|uniref:Cell shape-determining protein MreC n=1 Tax=Candidatus Fimadaptatus faecigallinarum TaxID=2840814 RepID=A0A9D1S5A7_9FIRM|nr:rod shape-determining protein MreC [Candidatus Fimadaptatus faecigallinarum]
MANKGNDDKLNAGVSGKEADGTGDELKYSARARASKTAPEFRNAEPDEPDLDESYYGEDIDRDFDALPPEDEDTTVVAPPESESEQPEAAEAPSAEAESDAGEAPEPETPPTRVARGDDARRGRRVKRSESKRRSARGERRSRRSAVGALLISASSLALVVILALSITGNSGVVTGTLGSVLAPVQGAVSAVTSTLQKTFNSFSYNKELEQAYNEAMEELATVQVRTARYDEVVAENERLRSLMENYEKYSQYDPIFARVIGKDTGNWFNNFTIDKGSANGVVENMTVMSADGVVGRVVEVGLDYAKVMAIIDGSSGVAALIERNRDNGVVRGMVDDTTGDTLLQMNYLPDINDVRTGDTVLTSGLDGVFIKGLPIGTVTQISRQSSGLMQYVVITPFADFEHIEEVILLKPQQ